MREGKKFGRKIREQTTEPRMGDVVLKSDFLSGKMGKSERAQKLRQASKYLMAIAEQPRDTKPYDFLAANLLLPSLQENMTTEILMLLSCCLADIFRIYAPEMPYQTKQIKEVQDIWFQALEKGLKSSKSNLFKSTLYLLEGLAKTRSLLVVFKYYSSSFQDFLQLVFKSAHHIPEQSQAIIYLVDIMSRCLESLTLWNSWLVHILLPLSPYGKSEKPSSFKLAISILDRCHETLLEPVQAILVELLDFNQMKEEEHPFYSLRGHVFDIIWELEQLPNHYTIDIIPLLEKSLLYEGIQERMGVVQLLCEMFADKNHLRVNEYHALFSTFLLRYNDKSPRIRCIMSEFAVRFMATFPDLYQNRNYGLEKELLRSLEDSSEEVRSSTVSWLCQSLSAHPQLLSIAGPLLVKMEERLIDKKTDVCITTVKGLANVFMATLRSMDLVEDRDEEEDIPEEVEWIPSAIIGAYSGANHATKHAIEHVVQRVFVLQDLTVEDRAYAIIDLVSACTDSGLQAFIDILASKRIFMDAFKEVYQWNQKKKLNLEEEAQLVEQENILLKQIPGSLETLRKIMSQKALGKHLMVLCDHKSTFPEVVGSLQVIEEALCGQDTHKEGIRKKVDMIEYVVERLANLLTSCDTFALVFNHLLELGINDDGYNAMLRFVRAIGKIYPHHMHQSLPSIVPLLSMEDRNLVKLGLYLLSSAQETQFSLKAKDTKSLRQALKKLVVDVEGDEQIGKRAAKLMNHYNTKTEVAQTMDRLDSYLIRDQKTYRYALTVLTQFPVQSAATLDFCVSVLEDETVEFDLSPLTILVQYVLQTEEAVVMQNTPVLKIMFQTMKHILQRQVGKDKDMVYTVQYLRQLTHLSYLLYIPLYESCRKLALEIIENQHHRKTPTKRKSMSPSPLNKQRKVNDEDEEFVVPITTPSGTRKSLPRSAKGSRDENARPPKRRKLNYEQA